MKSLISQLISTLEALSSVITLGSIGARVTGKESGNNVSKEQCEFTLNSYVISVTQMFLLRIEGLRQCYPVYDKCSYQHPGMTNSELSDMLFASVELYLLETVTLEEEFGYHYSVHPW